jgi:hypothetical protein
MVGFEKFRSYEKPGERLDGLMRSVAENLNRELQENGSTPLVQPDCSINMDAFEGFGVKEDKEEIRKRELEWSAAENPNVQAFYKDEFGIEGIDNIIARYKKDKEKGASGQLEKAITGVFYKILKSEYMVVRSATFDDYDNGVDNVIVNKRTGDVICAFDEVHGEKGQDRHDKKLEKVKKIAMRGGAKLKYGLSFENGTLIKKTLDNIPVFYLALSSDELKELLGKMSYVAGDKPNEVEIKFFDKLLATMESQAEILNKERIPQSVRTNIDKFQKSVINMKKLSLSATQ